MSEISVTIPKDYKPVPLLWRDEWLAALRSGQFKKGRIYLFNQSDKTYCVLGVLSHVQGRVPEAPNGKDLSCGLNRDNPCFGVLSDHGLFPPAVKVESDAGEFSTLSSLNDTSDMSFQQIAKLIETLYSAVESK
jgi:hypothetical protein